MRVQSYVTASGYLFSQPYSHIGIVCKENYSHIGILCKEKWKSSFVTEKGRIRRQISERHS